MEINYIFIYLLDGGQASIEYKDNEGNIYMYGGTFGRYIKLPIKYLDNLLQIIIDSRNDVKCNDILCIGHEDKYTFETYISPKNVNIKIDNSLTILQIYENLDVRFSYNGEENQLPLKWFNEEIREKLNYEDLLKQYIKLKNFEISEKVARELHPSFSQRILNSISSWWYKII